MVADAGPASSSEPAGSSGPAESCGPAESSDPASRPDAATRHLGLDLGGTNLKWTIVEHDGDVWRTLDRGSVVTRIGGTPDTIVEQLGDVGRSAIATWPDVATVGIGIPGLYDAATGSTRFLVNIAGDWD